MQIQNQSFHLTLFPLCSFMIIAISSHVCVMLIHAVRNGLTSAGGFLCGGRWQQGGSGTSFWVSRWCVYDWVKRGKDLSAAKPGPKGATKLDWDKLAKAVEKRPDAMLKELAEQFEVGTTAVWYALQQMKLVAELKRNGVSFEHYKDMPNTKL